MVSSTKIQKASFWHGKRVLLTGHTGFKGSWMCLALLELGAEVHGIALEPKTNPALYKVLNLSNDVRSNICDIRNLVDMKQLIGLIKPDIVIHMAAQPLVRESYKKPVETFETNVLGTVNILEASRSSENIEAILVVTTDKVYQNNEWAWGYRETDRLGGFDPYSNSKACAELVCSCYRSSFYEPQNIGLATARAGNVIGGGDWSEDRLIPDILRAIDNSEEFEIRSPHAIRPWQHVIEPVHGYLRLIEQLVNNPAAYQGEWNFGPADADAQSVLDIVNYMSTKVGRKFNYKIQAGDHPHEAGFLKLDNAKARAHLNWAPRWSLETALDKVVEWHDTFNANGNILEISRRQLVEYNKAK